MTYSRLVAILWLAVIMFFTAVPAGRCASPTDASCIRAVYKGAPNDYAQVQDIPADMLLTPNPDGRYEIERGQQITVVTAAPLPADYTRFYLQRRPLQVTVSPTSFEQLIPPVGTTYTFTATTDDRGSTLLSFNLTAARPLPISRTGIKPELGDVVVTTAFQVETTTLQYRTYATTGAVTTPGSYAFLSDPADTTSAVSTYEGLRDGATTGLLIHKSDAHGASQAALYDAVEADDLFEWRQADDCWVRYAVTEVKPDPTGIVPRKLLAVEWMTYAFSGCSGAVSTNVAASFAWGSLSDVGGTELMVPIRHGSFQIVPKGWTGTIERDPLRQWPGNSFENPVSTTDLSAAQLLPYWLDPVLPTDWTLVAASSGDPSSDPPYGYCARWNTEGDTGGVQICGGFMEALDRPISSSDANGGMTTETRVIAGRPAIVRFSPPGPQHLRLTQVEVWLDDTSRGVAYYIRGLDGTLIGANVDAVIAIARSLFEPPVQPQLGNLTGQRSLDPNNNRLIRAIPSSLRRLVNLEWLLLQDNQLSGPLPSQLGALMQMTKIYLLRNAGFSGCVPLPLNRVRYHHFDWLGLPDCDNDASATPATPAALEPTYTLTVIAGEGGNINPPGTTTHTEGVPVTLTASWNDATHTFAGWGGNCSGAATTCVLEMYANKTVTAAFTALPTHRCSSPTDADCIRAVHKGAPDDYAQVQDIPASVLIQPDDDGRYQVERGQQITVVTAARLPEGYNRFYLRSLPGGEPWPTSLLQLVLPAGTTYTFTVSANERAASSLDFQLHAATAAVVTTAFKVPPPLTLELASSRQLCTANTLTELSWTIAGGRPPYTLNIDGETVAANAESHRANCGPIPTDPFTGDPIPESRKRWTATVSDSQEPSASTRQRIEIELVEPLAPPPLIWMSAFGTRIAIAWTETEEHRAAVWYGKGGVYAIRFRLEDTIAWTYPRHHTGPVAWIELPVGDMTVQMAVLRAPIEQATPQALRWSENHRIARVEEPANATAVATHDTVTVSWDRQPLTGNHGDVTITAMDARASALSRNFYEDPDDRSTRFSFTFEHLPPDSDYEVTITYGSLGIAAISRTLEVRTQEAPENWQPLPSGPQNLRATAGHRWITVQWDPPFVGAEPSYLVQIFEQSDGAEIDHKYTKETEWTSYGSFRPVWPSTEYRISVLHTAIPQVEAEITITTPEPSDDES